MFVSTALVTTLLFPQWLPTGFAWNPGQFPIPYCIIPTSNRTSLSSAQLRSSIVQAIDYWRSTGAGGGTSCTNYNAAAASYTCSAVVDLGDRKNNIYFERNWRYGSQTLGVTSSGGIGNCGSVTDNRGTRHTLTCQGAPDIELNDANVTWDLVGRNGVDLVSIVTHEYGHFLGLDHCNDNNTCQQGGAVMYAAYLGGQFRVPRSDDVAGVCGMYPGQPGGVGFPCTTNGQCTSGQCANPGASGYCTASCGTCPTGFNCAANPSFPGGNTCVRDDGTNKAVCEVCNGAVPGACANNGLCIAGVPEQDTGRCVTPCPRPAAQNGGCAAGFTCANIQGAGGYCVPQSGDCTNIGSTADIPFGQACTGNPPCASGLECVSICTRTCTPGNASSCPAGYTCGTFTFQNGTRASYCAPPVGEGGSCNGFTSCTTGPCLSNGTTATCYRDCENNAGACNNAQTCETYSLQGGGSVSVCEPPGVPPRPDAGVVDSGSTSAPDATAVNPDATTTPGQDASMSTMPDAGGGGGGTCTCDQYLYCEEGCDCDPDCPCTCDVTFSCDDNCACDRECYGGSNSGGREVTARSCNCDAASDEADPRGLGLAGVAFIGLHLLRRRRLV